MNCFFLGGTENGDKLSREGIVSFAIPDLGVFFKTRHFGSSFECEYMSLLTLLAFIDRNPKIFSQQKIRIYTENPLIVHQINQKVSCSQDLKPHRDKALSYKEGFCYSISWIPSHENRSREVFFDGPVSHKNPNLDSDPFINSTMEKSDIARSRFS
jgi:hypothetical protein